jgi:hypothetical protein
MTMNPYTTRTQARIQPCDISRALLADRSTAALSLVSLERIRGWQAEAEVASLLKQQCVPLAPAAAPLTMLRQTLGASLVRVGHRLAGAPLRGASLAKALADGTMRTAS